MFVNFFAYICHLVLNCFQIELYHPVNTKLSSIVTSRQDKIVKYSAENCWEAKNGENIKNTMKITNFFILVSFLERILFTSLEIITLKWTIMVIKST